MVAWRTSGSDPVEEFVLAPAFETAELDAFGQLASGIEAQTRCCLDNIQAILTSAGLDLRNVFKATVWLTDISDFAAFNSVYAERFADRPPVRSTVCSALALPGALVEIEVTAYGG